MTSLLREEVAVPNVSSRSMTATDSPEPLSALATARPTTPAPTTTASKSGGAHSRRVTRAAADRT